MLAIEELWGRIHAWMLKYAPKMLDLLNPGINEVDLEYLQKSLNVNDLPEDFKVSYRIHDGSPALQFFGSEMVNSFQSSADITSDWRGLNDGHEDENNLYYERCEHDYNEIRNVMWSERWIPFGGDQYGNSLCLDLWPTDKGNYGQVIQLFNNGDTPILCASSFTEFLTGFMIDLENSKYILSANGQNLIYIEVDNK